MILVTGANGTIGELVVRNLKSTGEPFKAFVRGEAKGAALACDYVLGDFDDPASVRAALEGVDRLFLNGTVGPLFVQQQKAVIDAAAAAGVSYIVKVSSAGATHDAAFAIGRWHAEVDDHLQASGVRWSLLRPSGFMQNLLRSAPGVKQDSRIFGAYGDGRVAFIDASDIAACGVALLCAESAGATFVLTGGEALTYTEVAGKLSAALGRKVTYVDLPVDEIVSQAKARGTPPALAEGYGAMMRSIAEGRSVPLTAAVQELTGHAPRTLEEFLAGHIAQFR